jgi:CHASE3 domain sensor protein
MKNFLAWWQRVPLRAQAFILAAIPFIAVLISSVAAYDGNRQRQRAETDVIRKFAMVSDLSELLVFMVNAETGTRGYLLTGNTAFLQPYRYAVKRLPTQLNQLKDLAQAEPGLEPRLDKIARVARMQKLVTRQMELLTDLQEVAPEKSTLKISAQLRDSMASSKSVMDKLRFEIRGMHSEEDRLLGERLDEIKAIRNRDYIVIYLTLVVGLITRIVAATLNSAGISRRAKELTENIRAWKANQPLPHVLSPKPDALGELESEFTLTEADDKTPFVPEKR